MLAFPVVMVMVVMMPVIMVMMVMPMLFMIVVVMMVMFVFIPIVVVIIVIIVIMMVMMLMLLMVMVVMVMMMLVFILILVVIAVCHDFCQDLCLEVGPAFNGLQDHSAVQVGKRSGDDGGLFVVLSEQGHGFVDFCVGHLVGTGQDDGAGMLDLVDEELTEVLDIKLCLGTVHHCHGAVQFHFRILGGAADSCHDLGKLAYARGLDQDPFGSVCGHDFTKRSAEVAYQRAADAAAVHLTDLYAGFL